MTNFFTHSHRVPYSECTLGNHVYYARYLDILEEARGEFFRHLGRPLLELQSSGQLFPVTEVQIQYKGAARYDDLLEVRLSVLQASRIRLQFKYQIYRANILLIEAQTSHVSTGVDEKPKRMQPELLQLFAPYLVASNPPAADNPATTRADSGQAVSS